MRILILGANGMIGSSIYRTLFRCADLEVFGVIRDINLVNLFPLSTQKNFVFCGDLSLPQNISSLLERIKPEVVINCAGITKHLNSACQPEVIITTNTDMPHRFADACHAYDARFIHISTDCVFSGLRGGYIETDVPDATDLYGRSKALGEVINGSSITLRTSTIGHELCTKFGLLEWFLSQDKECEGFTKAIFSGLPSVIFAQVIKDFVLPNGDLKGLYHVAADPINKYDLLTLIANIYGKKIDIKQDREFTIDRSLSYEKFKAATGYVPAAWPYLIETMYNNYKADTNYV
jgi:dTDP-4-dehydrorhamnose reductase